MEVREYKTVFVAYNQAYHSLILHILERQNIKGYTYWQGVQGRGSRGGEPHLGNHAWPTMNDAMLIVVKAEAVAPLLEALRALDERTPQQGLRAFVWSVEQYI